MKLSLIGLLACVALWGCVTAPAPQDRAVPQPAPTPAPVASSAPYYRCDNNIGFAVRFMDDSAVLEGGVSGNEVLLRDAGGVTPQQTVYSNARLRAEFGLGATGREAILRYLSPPLVARCLRD